jgi:hypothetical protein
MVPLLMLTMCSSSARPSAFCWSHVPDDGALDVGERVGGGGDREGEERGEVGEGGRMRA